MKYKPKFQAGDILIKNIEFAKELGYLSIIILKVGEVNYLYSFYEGSANKYSRTISHLDDDYIKISLEKK